MRYTDTPQFARVRAAMAEAYRLNAEANRASEARRHPENDLERDLANENGEAEADWLQRRGYVDEYGV